MLRKAKIEHLNNRYFGVAFCLIWFTILIKTESFISVYFYVCFGSILAILFAKRNVNINKRNKTITLSFSTLLSFFVTISNYNIYTSRSASSYLITIISGLILVFILGIFVFYNILLCVYVYYPVLKHKAFNQNVGKPKKVFIYSFLFLFFIYFFVFVLIDYPGILTSDSVYQVKQIQLGAGNYTNHHPYWHTMLIKVFYDIGYRIFRTPNMGIATYSFFQLTFVSAVIAFSNKILCELGTNKSVNVLYALFFGIMPYNILYSHTIWKDIIFSICVLLFLVSLVRIFMLDDCRNNILINRLFLFFSGIGICLFRSNGLYAFLLLFFVFTILFFRTNKIEILVMTIVILIASFLNNTFINSMNIKQPDILEYLSIPIQQVSRVVNDCDDLKQNDKETINRVINIGEIKKSYLPYISDPVKDLIREKGDIDYLVNNKRELFNLYINIGLNHPIEYAKAWIDQTKGYYNGGYSYWVTKRWVDPEPNDCGIYSVVNNKYLSLAFDCYNALFNKETLQITRSIGVFFWIVIAVLYIGILNKNRVIVLMTIPLFSIYCTLMITTPVFCEFRYVYSTIISIFFVVVSSIYFYDNKKDDNYIK